MAAVQPNESASNLEWIMWELLQSGGGGSAIVKDGNGATSWLTSDAQGAEYSGDERGLLISGINSQNGNIKSLVATRGNDLQVYDTGMNARLDQNNFLAAKFLSFQAHNLNSGVALNFSAGQYCKMEIISTQPQSGQQANFGVSGATVPIVINDRLPFGDVSGLFTFDQEITITNTSSYPLIVILTSVHQ